MTDDVRKLFENLPERLEGERFKGLETVYVFEIDGAGTWTVRLENGELRASEGADPAADCTISASEEDFGRVLRRELSATAAYFSGRIKIRGDLGAATRLPDLISSWQGGSEPGPPA